MRFACDTGGTFTDLVVEHDDGTWTMHKAPTVPDDPSAGVLDALSRAAASAGRALDKFLAAGDIFIHGTTHALNAVLTGNTAKTALLTTRGHRDVLYLREGGRADPFDHTIPYPRPYIDRALTIEVPERICADGAVLEPLDPAAVARIVGSLREAEVEAVAICLLWSIVNPVHEQLLGRMIREGLPGIPVTLSHELIPIAREYRRASATAINASLVPLMGRYIGGLADRLRAAGFAGRVLMLTSQGGMQDARDVATTPIRLINSGPSMAPGGGWELVRRHTGASDLIVADTGGTTYDVSLVRNGVVPITRETWIGSPYRGHMSGLPSVDVKSVGAGGGSIAWVDAGGVLHVGPQSAGAAPGPACYGRGGATATVTDAAVVLGYIDPDYFLGGQMQLEVAAALEAVEDTIASPLGFDIDEAAAAILSIATENMVQAIEEITVNRGVDPTSAALIGGGGAAGLNSIFIAQRLRCPELVIPPAGSVLSAAGALLSDLSAEERTTWFTTISRFDIEVANHVLTELESRARAFLDGPGASAVAREIEFRVEARYRNQVWEIDVPLATPRFSGVEDVARLEQKFHEEHARLFAVSDVASDIEIICWVATARCRLRERMEETSIQAASTRICRSSRRAYFPGFGRMDVPVLSLHAVATGNLQEGPAIVESPFTTIVIDPRSAFRVTEDRTLIAYPCRRKSS